MMRAANSLTCWVCDLEAASLPASMSTWFAVTTMAAICASLGPSAAAAAVVRHRLVAITTPIILMIRLLGTGIRRGGAGVAFQEVKSSTRAARFPTGKRGPQSRAAAAARGLLPLPDGPR